MKAPTTVFLVLLIEKLTHVITWSWWWITAPIWMYWICYVLGSLVWAGYTIRKEGKSAGSTLNARD